MEGGGGLKYFLQLGDGSGGNFTWTQCGTLKYSYPSTSQLYKIATIICKVLYLTMI